MSGFHLLDAGVWKSEQPLRENPCKRSDSQDER